MANNRRDYYLNQRSWLIDTAETPEDQKNLKRDLAKLDAQFNPNRVAKKISKATTKKTALSKPAAKSSPKARVTPTSKTTKKTGKK